MMSMQMYLELILAKWSIKPMKTWNKSMKILSCRNLKEISKALSFYTLARDIDRLLEQTPFCFFPWGCPFHQILHIQFEFPAIFCEKCKNILLFAVARTRIRDLLHVSLTCYLKTSEEVMYLQWKTVVINACGGKFKVSMSNLKQGASSW